MPSQIILIKRESKEGFLPRAITLEINDHRIKLKDVTLGPRGGEYMRESITMKKEDWRLVVAALKEILLGD